MIAAILLVLLLGQSQQGPKSLDVDPNKVLPPVVVPAGTVIPVSLTSRITTKHAKDGDGIYGKTAFPVTVNNKIVIPEGSMYFCSNPAMVTDRISHSSLSESSCKNSHRRRPPRRYTETVGRAGSQ